MALTASQAREICIHLLDTGLLTPVHLERGVEIRRGESQSHLYLISVNDSLEYVYKEQSSRQRATVEAAAHHLLQEFVSEETSSTLIFYDPQSATLVFRGLHGSTAHDLAVRNELSLRHLIAVVQTLSAIHHADIRESAQVSNLTAELPWVLRHDVLSAVTPHNPESRAILARFVQTDAFRQVVQSISRDWKINCLLHGDIRLSNIIVGFNGRAQLIDWEAAAFGSAEYDLGSLLASLFFTQLTIGSGLRGAQPQQFLATLLSDYGDSENLTRPKMIWAAGATRVVQHAFENAQQGCPVPAESWDLFLAMAELALEE